VLTPPWLLYINCIVIPSVARDPLLLVEMLKMYSKFTKNNIFK
jgi:hypothetical protein